MVVEGQGIIAFERRHRTIGNAHLLMECVDGSHNGSVSANNSKRTESRNFRRANKQVDVKPPQISVLGPQQLANVVQVVWIVRVQQYRFAITYCFYQVLGWWTIINPCHGKVQGVVLGVRCKLCYQEWCVSNLGGLNGPRFWGHACEEKKTHACVSARGSH